MWYNLSHQIANARPTLDMSSRVLTVERDYLSMATSDSTSKKRCGKCGEYHPATSEYFYIDKRVKSKTGFKQPCKKCCVNKERQVRKTDEYRERERIRSAARRQSDDVKEYHTRYLEEYNKTYKQTDAYKDSVKRHNKTQYQKMLKSPDLLERRKTELKEWMKTPRGLALARKLGASRKARKMSAEGYYTHDDVLEMYVEQEGRCAYCGISIYFEVRRDLHIDHVRPLARGGSNWPDNLALACQSCNCSKADKLLEEWIRDRGW